MIIAQIKKEMKVLNEMEASFCNCSKPNVVSQVKAQKLSKCLKKAYAK